MIEFFFAHMKALQRTALAVFILLLASGTALAGPIDNASQAINYLIDSVRTSDLSFVRNGSTYTAREAAAHLKAKYDYFQKQIKTPEDFIRLAGSKSELSGKAYLVKTPDGRTIPSAEWLGSLLAKYRAALESSGAVTVRSPSGL
jgi:Family of unknown function (DUF5329)